MNVVARSIVDDGGHMEIEMLRGLFLGWWKTTCGSGAIIPHHQFDMAV